MDWNRPIAALAVVLIVFSAVGALTSIVTTNALLVDSQWQTPAIGTLAVSLLVVLFVVLLGRPSGNWKRTTYW